MCVHACVLWCVIMLQVNKCLQLSLKCICSQRLHSVYQLLPVGESITKQITHEFIHLGPCTSGDLTPISCCRLCRHVHPACVRPCGVCTSCVTSGVYTKNGSCLLSTFQTDLEGNSEEKGEVEDEEGTSNKSFCCLCG